MTKNTRFSPEVRQRAIRMVLESQGEYDSQWAAICSIVDLPLYFQTSVIT